MGIRVNPYAVFTLVGISSVAAVALAVMAARAWRR